MPRIPAILVLALTLTAGCGEDGGGQSTADAEVDATVTPVMCTGANPSFPTFARTCSAATDCAIAFHQYNCCGSRRAQGISKSQKAAFDAAEATCVAQYPGCGCAASETIAEDGKSGPENTIMVTCTAVGTCSTFIP